MKFFLLLITAIVISVTSFAISDTEKIFEIIEKNNVNELREYITSYNINGEIKKINENSSEYSEGIPIFYTTTPLIYAISLTENSNNNIDLIKFLLEKGANTETMSIDRETPLTTAVNNNNIDIIKLLLKHGVDINFPNNYNSPIAIAVNNNNYSLVQFLLKEGAYANGQTLINAIENRNIEVFKELVQNGGDINYYDDDLDMSVIRSAIIYGGKEFVEILLNKNVNFNYEEASVAAVLNKNMDKLSQLLQQAGQEDSNKFSLAMITAITMNNLVAVNKLLDRIDLTESYYNDPQITETHWRGVTIDIPNHAINFGSKEVIEVFLKKLTKEGIQDMFYDAILSGKKETIDLFIKYGAKINPKDTSLLEAAISTNNVDIVKKIVNAGALVNITKKSSEEYETMQPASFALSNTNNPEIVNFLISKGAEYDKNELLLYGAKYNSISLMEVAIKNKANINYKENLNNENALELALENNNKEAVNFLWINGIKVISKESLLSFALQNKLENISRKLLLEEINIDVKDINGKSLLLIAAESSNKEIIETIVNKGANIEDTDKENNNALLLAIKNNNFSIVEYLLSIGISPNTKNSNNDSALELAIKSNDLILLKTIILKPALYN